MTQGAGPDPSERPAAGVAPPERTATGGAPGESPVPFTFAPTVTLFFSDIRGFTEYTDAHGDAAAFRMLQPPGQCAGRTAEVELRDFKVFALAP